MAEAMRVLDEAIAARARAVAAGAGAGRARVVRLEAETSVGTERARRVADEVAARCSSAPATTTGSAAPGSCAPRPRWIAGRVEQADEAWARPRPARGARGDERELFGILGWRATAAVLGPTPVDDAIRRCEAFRELVEASPVAAALMVNPLALAARDAAATSSSPTRSLARGQRDAAPAREPGLGVAHEALVQAARGPAGARRAPLRAGRRAARLDERRRVAGDDDRDARSGRLRAGAAGRGRRAVRGGRRRRRARRHRHPGDLARREGQDPRSRGPREEARGARPRGVALVAPTDLLSHHGDAMLDLAEVLRTMLAHRRVSTQSRTRLFRCTRRRATSLAPRARGRCSANGSGGRRWRFKRNFTQITLGADVRSRRVEGTRRGPDDDRPSHRSRDPCRRAPRRATPLTATVEPAGSIDWEVKFPADRRFERRRRRVRRRRRRSRPAP